VDARSEVQALNQTLKGLAALPIEVRGKIEHAISLDLAKEANPESAILLAVRAVLEAHRQELGKALNTQTQKQAEAGIVAGTELSLATGGL
jgi:hypothetical protein